MVKIDHTALRQVRTTRKERKRVQPKGKLEQDALAVWMEILNEKDLGVTDDFFEAGGDSIKAVQIISRLGDKGIRANAVDIMNFRSIAELSSRNLLVNTLRQYQQSMLEGEMHAVNANRNMVYEPGVC
jgi:surfactin family lipopeptide synthetase A